MTPLTPTQLDQLMIKVLSYVSIYRPAYYWYFDTLYKSGARASEPLIPDLWSIFGRGQVRLQPLKSNNLRNLSATEYNSVIPSLIASQNWPLRQGNISMLQNLFKSALYPNTLLLDSDNTLLHTFRYNFVKKLHSTGMSMTNITTKMGWKTNDMAPLYVYKEIFLI